MTHIKPYLSVQYADDNECLEILIRLHAETQTPVIVDTTHNTGKMWKGCKFQPTWKLDLMPYPIQAQADFKALPLRSGCCDVLVFDPPHVGIDSTTTGIVSKWGDIYGLTSKDTARNGSNIIGLFAPVIAEAQRVLKHGGVLLTKLTDTARTQRYQWEMVEFVNAARGAGMTPCDLMIKVSNVGNLVSGRWQTQQHLRRTHSYWVVVRNAGYDAAHRNFAVNYERPYTVPMFDTKGEPR